MPPLRILRFSCVALLASVALHAQSIAPTVNPNSREEVRQFFRGLYAASENVPQGWTGSYATGNAGDSSAAFKEATRLRINFFRALVGVPAQISFNATFSAKAQLAAFMMSGNNTLQHTNIPTSWTFYSAEGAEAAAKANLHLGGVGPDAITAYVRDEGVNNFDVGHRRWLFYPQTLQMGTGDVPGEGTSTRRAANAVWVVVQDPQNPLAPGNFGTTRPPTRTTEIAYPPAGWMPYQLVWPRWSFSYPGADFSAATVTMTRGGQAIPVALEANTPGAGEPTLVWVYDGLDSNSIAPHAAPASDVVYSVRVDNVRIAGASRNFSYNVTVFDPAVAGSDGLTTTIASAGQPAVGTAGNVTVTKHTFATGFDWRVIQLSPFATTFGAENGLDGLTATTVAGYNVVQTALFASGRSAYRLAHTTQRSDQILTVPGTFLVGDTAAITFRSRLGIATAIETAKVQVSLDDGGSWTSVFTQLGTTPTTGTPTPTENAFAARSLSLAAYRGRTIQVRFVYSIAGTGLAFLPEGDNGVGWYLDDVTVTDAQAVTAGSATRVASGSTFSFTPAFAGAIALQARGVLFGDYPLEWGTPLAVTVGAGGSASNAGRIINLSILTSIAAPGDSFTMGYVVGGDGTSGAKPLVIRAAGPSLGALGVPGTLDDPKMELFAGPNKTGENDNWGGGAELTTALVSVGAFAYTGPTSRDAAALVNITGRDNSVKVSAAGNGTGTVIAEIYDATPAASFATTTPRLVNVSVLKPIGNGLTAGFVIGGSGSKRVLIRAIGPGLSAFGITTGFVADPQLTLFGATGAAIGTNDNWGGTATLSAAFTQVGAFPLTATSRDAALLAELAPGNYTVEVKGVANTTGLALVEVYEAP